MKIVSLHAWDVTPQEAINIQKQLASRIIIQEPVHPIRFIAGLDMAFTKDGSHCIAGVVLWDAEQKVIIEQHTALRPVHFPYVPGLLSFREIPTLIDALVQLKKKPDLLMCDGQGLAHPRGMGIASHIGLIADMSTIGCGKSRLCGTHTEPGPERGQKTQLVYQGKVVGTVLRTKNRTKPIYVSVGHKMDLPTAEKIVLDCFNGYRLPEPTRLADKLVADIKKRG